MPSDPDSATDEAIRRWRAGEQDALERLMPAVYAELRSVARRHLRNERADHTLQTTALIHEAYVRFAERGAPQFADRSHFVALTSCLMRQILVDHARRRLARKRLGGSRIALAEDHAVIEPRVVDILAVDTALRRLSQLDAQQGRIVELRYFGGLSISETADALGISEATVKRDWATARAWLHREMQHPPADAP